LKIIEIIGDGLIIGLGAFSVRLLTYIWEYGEVICIEPNRAILTGEIIVACVIVIIGIERGLKDIMAFGKKIKGC